MNTAPASPPKNQGGLPFHLGLMALLAVAYVLFTKAVRRGLLDVAPLKAWLINYPHQAACDFLIFAAFCVLVVFISRGFRFAHFAFAVLVIAFVVANKTKIMVLGSPVSFADLKLTGQAAHFAPEFIWKGIEVRSWIEMAIAASLLLYVMVRIPYRWSLGAFPYLVILLAGVGVFAVSTTEHRTLLGYDGTPRKRGDEIALNGLWFSFATTAHALKMAEPPNYSRASIKELSARYLTARPPSAADATSKPNVVIIMSEAFWNPAWVPGLRFARELPLAHVDIPNFEVTKFGSPTNAGGTHRTEFELLTGTRFAFFPRDSVPYIQFIKGDVEALPWIFKKDGYLTNSYHPFSSNFWGRLQTYPHLGFEHRYFAEDFAIPADTVFEDADLFDRVYRDLQKTDGPSFNFLVTIQNHAPFDDAKKWRRDLGCAGFPAPTSDFKMDPDAQKLLSHYTEQVCVSSEALKIFLGQLRSLPRETIVVHFGDHNPHLGNLYNEAGMVKPDGSYGTLMNQTPLYIWDSKRPLKIELPRGLDDIPAYLLGSWLLETTGVPPEGAFALDHDLYQTSPADRAPLNEALKLLTYDEFFGARYWRSLAAHSQ